MASATAVVCAGSTKPGTVTMFSIMPKPAIAIPVAIHVNGRTALPDIPAMIGTQMMVKELIKLALAASVNSTPAF